MSLSLLRARRYICRRLNVGQHICAAALRPGASLPFPALPFASPHKLECVCLLLAEFGHIYGIHTRASICARLIGRMLNGPNRRESGGRERKKQKKRGACLLACLPARHGELGGDRFAPSFSSYRRRRYYRECFCKRPTDGLILGPQRQRERRRQRRAKPSPDFRQPSDSNLRRFSGSGRNRGAAVAGHSSPAGLSCRSQLAGGRPPRGQLA